MEARGGNELRDARSDDTGVELLPANLTFGNLDGGEEDSGFSAMLDGYGYGYGYGGYAGPFWMESAFTALYYIPEGNEAELDPFWVRCSHEDAYGLEVTLSVT